MSTIILICVLLNFHIPQVSAIETGELQNNLDPMEVTIPIAIKLWGFDSSFQLFLNTSIPDHIIHEAYNPKANDTTQFGINIFNNPVGQINHLNIEYELKSAETLSNTTALVSKNTRINQPDPLGSNKTYTGYQLDAENMASAFTPFNDEKKYTIHLLNYSSINDQIEENSTHWYSLGETVTIPTYSYDMRNIIVSGFRGIVFDPTAIAPYFGYSGIPSNEIEFNTYIINGIIDLFEKVIVGSPLTNNYLALERYIEVASVVVGSAESDEFYNRAGKNLAYLQFRNEVSRLFSYFNINHKQVNMLVSTVPEFENLLAEYTQIIDSTPTVIVDSNFAERLKNIIRSNYYTEFPKGYYYSTFIMVDSADLRFAYQTDDGLVDYQIGELGVGINKPNEWYENGLPAEILKDSLRQMLQIFGRIFGLPVLNTPYSAQIPSPMSTYGVTSNWDGRYTQFEQDSVDRRYAMLYRTATEIRIERYSDALDGSIYFWFDTPRFDNATDILQVADSYFEDFNFKVANTKYIEAFEEAEYQVESIDYLTTSVENGAYLAVIVGVIFLYIKYMREAAISKDEFLERVEKIKTKNRDLGK